jgi:hypothetical protein
MALHIDLYDYITKRHSIETDGAYLDLVDGMWSKFDELFFRLDGTPPAIRNAIYDGNP